MAGRINFRAAGRLRSWQTKIDRPIRGWLVLAVLLEVFIWFLWKVKIEWPGLPFYISTHLAPPKLSLLILAVNGWLAAYSWRKIPVVAGLLIGGVIFFQIMILALIFFYIRYQSFGAGFS